MPEHGRASPTTINMQLGWGLRTVCVALVVGFVAGALAMHFLRSEKPTVVYLRSTVR